MRVEINWDLVTDENPEGERNSFSPPEVVEVDDSAASALLTEANGDEDQFMELLEDMLSDDYGFLIYSVSYNELPRRSCGCGGELDRDCNGTLRCSDCDGPCLSCYDGGGP